MFHIRRISEEYELDYLSSLLEIDDKTSKDNSQPSVGMYSYVYLYGMYIVYSRGLFLSVM